MSRKKNSGSASLDVGATILPTLPDLRVTRHKPKEFEPLNKSQQNYLSKIESHVCTFAIGSAGTGKTFCAALAAAKAFRDKRIDKIVVTRPVIEADEEQLGFLPGDMNEKFQPYVQPLIEALSQILGSGNVEALVENGRIQFLPMAFMRGASLSRTFLIADEMQNATKTQMKLLLTRLGNDTIAVINGDITQRDRNVDGLMDAMRRLKSLRSVAIQEFGIDDIVRSGFTRDVLLAYGGYDTPSIEEEDEGLSRYLK